MKNPARARHRPDDVGAFFDRATDLFHQLSGSPFLNLGLWQRNTRLIATAQRRIVVEFGAFCGLARRDRVLDVGCGTGAQDLVWMEAFHPASIHGVNVSARQVAYARAGAANAGRARSITYEVGDACRLRKQLRGFSRVVALECAHLFPDLPAFFRGARQALTTGGKLMLANLTPFDERAFSPEIARGIVASLRDAGIELAELPLARIVEEERSHTRLFAEITRMAAREGFSVGRVEDVGPRVAPFYGPFIRRTRELLAASTSAEDRQALTAFAISFAGRQQQFANGSLGYLFVEFTA